jgi:hypothetical protein
MHAARVASWRDAHEHALITPMWASTNRERESL